MFEVGWTEMLVIAVVMIVVVGPKDLPVMLRQFGRTTAKLRAMAGDFRRQFDEALKEAELDDVKKSVDDLRRLNPATEVRKQLNPFAQAAQEVRAGIETAMKPKPPIASEPAAAVAQAAEPLKAGATGTVASSGPPPPVPDVMKTPAADSASIAAPPPADTVETGTAAPAAAQGPAEARP